MCLRGPPLLSLGSARQRAAARMSALWVDKYRPQSLDRLDYHKDQAAQLARLAAAGDLPHMLFYGPSGAGKKTRVMALLRAIFGAGVERVKLQHRAFKTPSGKAIEVTTIVIVIIVVIIAHPNPAAFSILIIQ